MALGDLLGGDTALTPHGFCLLWRPGLIWVHAIADLITMLAYYSIPLALIHFSRHRADLPHRWLAILFAAFIVACGTTHAMSLFTLWVPAYYLEGAVKALTALLSIFTAATLWPLMPRLLALPSAKRMTELNTTLNAMIASQTQTTLELSASQEQLLRVQDDLRRINAELEVRVAERTDELIRSNDAIRRSEARFRRVVEAAPSGIVMVNAYGTIEMVNAQIERLFEFSREELIGQAIEVLLPERFRSPHPKLRAEFFSELRSRPMGAGSDLFGRRRNGDEFEIEVGLSPFETEDGMMVLGAIEDVSRRVRLEAQLRQSQKMEAIGKVAAGVAHDFNNLLLALGGSIELLLEAAAEVPAAAEWGQVALRAVDRGSELTHRLLSFSRQQVLRARPVLIAEVFAELSKLIGHMFGGTTIGADSQLIVDPGRPGLAVLADLAQLEAALINLTVNALDAMRAGGCLRISAYEAEQDPTLVPKGRYTVISVADTGSGMDTATLAQACEPFFTTKGVNGTGLGLSMVQGFARQSGGEAHITSVLGEGTTVDLWLPSTVSTNEPTPRPRPPQSAGGRVLVVDDSPDALLVVGSFLRLGGLDVTGATDGDLALAELRSGRQFDVLVTDFAMPGMNGVELLRQALELDPQLPGLIMTGFSQRDVLPDLDGIIVLRKPFNRAELLAAVHSLIKCRQPAPENSSPT
jgi:PAS domain S-box-containing protein